MCRVAADPDTVAYFCFSHNKILYNVRIVLVIREHDTMTNKRVRSNYYTFANKAVRLNTCIVPNFGVLLDLDEGTNQAVLANFTAVQVY